MTVQMIFIRRLGGNPQAAENNEGSAYIGRGFHRIGNQRIGMSEDTCDGFHRRERDVYDDADQSGLRSDCGGLVCVRTVHAHEKLWLPIYKKKGRLAPASRPGNACQRRFYGIVYVLMNCVEIPLYVTVITT